MRRSCDDDDEYWEPSLQVNLTVYDDDDPEWTGLYGPDGQPLYRYIRQPIGFRFSENE